MKMVYWKEEDFYLGKLLDHPEIMTQGKSVDELVENIKEVYNLMVMEGVIMIKENGASYKITAHIAEKKVPGFGSAKNLFEIHNDFDEPIYDFKKYMS